MSIGTGQTEYPFTNSHPRIARALLIILAVLFAASLISLIGWRGGAEAVYTQSADKNTLLGADTFGYDITDGFYTVSGGDPQIHLSLSTEKVNLVKIYFEKLKSFNSVQLYYSVDGEEFSEAGSRFGYLAASKDYCFVMLPDVELSRIRMDIDGSFSLSHAEFLRTEITPAERAVSPFALVILILLTVAALAAAVFEPRLGYYSLIFEFLKKAVLPLIDMKKNGQYLKFSVRILTFTAGAVFILPLTSFLMLSAYSPKLSTFVFICAAVFAAVFILDRFLAAEKRAAVFFLVLSLIIGVTVVFCQPPTVGASWDEEIHYGRTLNVENTLLFGNKTLGDVFLIDRIESYHTYSGDFTKLYGRGSLDRLVYADGTEIYSSGMRTSGHLYINPYMAVSYIPTALVLSLFDHFGADILTRVVMPKMANVIMYTAILYFAMRRLRSGAAMFAAVAMLPTALFLTGSFSYDPVITALAGYSFIYLISLLQDKDKKIGFAEGAHILVPMIIGCAAKAIYFLSAAPLLFVRRDKFESEDKRKKLIIISLLVMLCIALSFLLPFLIDSDIRSDDRGGEGIDASDQLSFIFGNPLKYAGILIKFLLGYISFENTALLSGSFAYLGFGMNYIGTLSVALVIITAFTDRSERDMFRGSGLFKGVSLLLVAAQLALIATSLYISYTSVGSETVAGCQFRYMIPLMFAASYSIGFPGVTVAEKRCLYNTAVFALLAFAAFGAAYYNIIIKF